MTPSHHPLTCLPAVCSEDLIEAVEKLKLASADGAAASVDGCLDSLLRALASNSEWSCKLLLPTPTQTFAHLSLVSPVQTRRPV